MTGAGASFWFRSREATEENHLSRPSLVAKTPDQSDGFATLAQSQNSTFATPFLPVFLLMSSPDALHLRFAAAAQLRRPAHQAYLGALNSLNRGMSRVLFFANSAIAAVGLIGTIREAEGAISLCTGPNITRCRCLRFAFQAFRFRA